MAKHAITSETLDDVRDKLSNEIENLLIGTDGTEPTTSDTALGSEVRSESATVKKTGTGKVEASTRLDTSEANGNTLREAGLEDSSGNLQERSTYLEIVKDNTKEIEYKIEIAAEDNN